MRAFYQQKTRFLTHLIALLRFLECSLAYIDSAGGRTPENCSFHHDSVLSRGPVLTLWVLLTSAALGLVCRSASPLNQAFRYFSPGNIVQESRWWNVLTLVKLFLWELLPCFSHTCQPSPTPLNKVHDEVPSGWLHDYFKLYVNMLFPSSFKGFIILQQSMWKENYSRLAVFKRKTCDLFSSNSSQSSAR